MSIDGEGAATARIIQVNEARVRETARDGSATVWSYVEPPEELGYGASMLLVEEATPFESVTVKPSVHFVAKGNGHLTLEGEEHRVREGALIDMPQGTEYVYSKQGPGWLSVLRITIEPQA